MSNVIIDIPDLLCIENQIFEDTGKKKQFFIEGIFAQSEKKNGNGRSYPKRILETQVNKLSEKIQQNRLIGELDHPQTAEINLNRVSHLIKELKMDGNDCTGRAMIIVDTPCGLIAKALMESGVKLGVSTRGLGTVKNGVVQSDFILRTIDIVADPSAPDAFISAIIESKTEWVLENGILVEKDIENIIKDADSISLEHKFSKEEKTAAFMNLFQDMIKKISDDIIHKGVN